MFFPWKNFQFCFFCFFKFAGNNDYNVGRPVETGRCTRAEIESFTRSWDARSIKECFERGALDYYIGDIAPDHKRLMVASVSINIAIMERMISENFVTLPSAMNPFGQGDGISVSLSVIRGLTVSVWFKFNRIRQQSCLLKGQDLAYLLCGFHDIDPFFIRTLIERYGCDIRNRRDEKFSCFMKAATVGNVRLIELMKDYGSINEDTPINVDDDVILQYPNYWNIFTTKYNSLPRISMKLTLLHIAIIASWPEFEIIKLIDWGADVDINRGVFPMEHFLASHNMISVIKMLMGKNRFDIRGRDWAGATILHKAVQAGSTDIIEMFLPHFDVNVADYRGWTPLHWASVNSNRSPAQLYRLLIDRGGDVNARTDTDFTPWHIFIAWTNPQFLFFMRDKFQTLWTSPVEDDLMDGDWRDDMEDVMRLFINKKADCNIADGLFGWTALHWGAAVGNLRISTLLFESGVCRISRSKRGRNPFETAKFFNRRKVSDYFQRVGRWD